MYLKDINVRVNWYLSAVIVIVALLVLGISLVQASWATLNIDNNMDRFRINPVEFEVENERGDGIEMVKYNLPQVTKMPVGFWYETKKWRDKIWISFSTRRDKIERANLYMLLADKKIAEMLVLSQAEELDALRMYEFGLSSIKYLEGVKKLTTEMNNPIEVSKLEQRLERARFFYKEVYESVGEITNQKEMYEDLIYRLESIES